MKTQFPTAPPERLIEDTGDGLKFLRTLRNQYMTKGVNPLITGDYYRNSAQAVADLIPRSVTATIEQYADYELNESCVCDDLDCSCGGA